MSGAVQGPQRNTFKVNEQVIASFPGNGDFTAVFRGMASEWGPSGELLAIVDIEDSSYTVPLQNLRPASPPKSQARWGPRNHR